MNDLFANTETSGADFSPCRAYRYLLWRIWAPSDPLLHFCMLNPSDADEVNPDPTVGRCITRARLGRFGGILVTNLFALVSPYPTALRGVEDPVGPGNDEAIVSAAKRAAMTICAWGNDGGFRKRSAAVRALLRKEGIDLYALMMNEGGEPSHPLYLKKSLQPFIFYT